MHSNIPTSQTDNAISSSATFNILFTGLRQDVDASQAIIRLASLFKIPVEQVESLVALQGFMIKKSVSEVTAQSYRQAIEAAGGVCEIQPDIQQVTHIPVDLSSSIQPDETATIDIKQSHRRSANSIDPQESKPVATTMHGAEINAAELKNQINTKTWHFVLLTAATIGIYPLLWLTRHHEIFNKVTKKQTVSMPLIVCLAICIGISLALNGTRNQTGILVFLAAYLLAVTLYLVLAFRAKRALQEYALNTLKIDLRMSPVYTFLFTMFYINYCINDIPEVLRRQQILTNQRPT
jgi:hypothetical protein